MSSDVTDINIVEMINIEKHAATTVQARNQQCGIKAETTVPIENNRSPTGTMSLVSYAHFWFLFVLDTVGCS